MGIPVTEQADYSKLIDKEIWAFIHRTQQYYPDDTTKRTIEEQRAIYTGLCDFFSDGYPEDVSSEDATIVSHVYDVPVRRYQSSKSNSNTIVVYMHGGGFVVGGLDSHDSICAELCSKTGYKVTSVDYRLSPEHKHPAAFDDCLACVESEAQLNNVPVLLCGDSAGGNLAAAVAHRLSTLAKAEKKVKLVGQALIYPELGGDTTVGSYLTHANAPMLTSDEVSFYLQVRVDTELPLSDPSFAPLHASSFSGLPETLVVSAECDPLSDDGRNYCDAIVKAGGVARWINEPGLVHGFLRARHTSVRARESFESIIEALKKLGTSCTG